MQSIHAPLSTIPILATISSRAMIKYISVNLQQKGKLALKTCYTYQSKVWQPNLANTRENAEPF